MATDEEIIRAYEAELSAEPPRRNSRGFWVILGVTVAASVFVLVEIFAHRPLANSIGLAQESLRRSQRAAEQARTEAVGFAEADDGELADALPALTFRGAAESSTGVRDVSVSATEDVWAAAVQVRPEACFYLRLEVGEDPRYGAGSECTGEAALSADQPRW
jgi:hypothetical protein